VTIILVLHCSTNPIAAHEQPYVGQQQSDRDDTAKDKLLWFLHLQIGGFERALLSRKTLSSQAVVLINRTNAEH
jgi:hypothetical protein